MDFQDLSFLVLAGLSFAVFKMLPRLIAGVPFVDPGDVKRMLDAGEAEVVVDVRSAGDFNGKLGHIPGAINLPLPDLTERLKQMTPDMEHLKYEPVFVNCRRENIAAHAARRLKKAGFIKVAVVKGGIKAWNRNGLPIERTG